MHVKFGVRTCFGRQGVLLGNCSKKLITKMRPTSDIVVSIDSATIRCCTGHLIAVVKNHNVPLARVLMLDSLLPQFDLVFGIDVIEHLGRLSVKDGKIVLGVPVLGFVLVKKILVPSYSLIQM